SARPARPDPNDGGRLPEGGDFPDAASTPGRERARRRVRDPAQHARRGRPDPRLQDVPDPDRDPDRLGARHAADGYGAPATGQRGHDRSARGLRPGAAQGGLRGVPRRRGRRRGVSVAQPVPADNRIDRFLAILPKRSGSDLHLAVGCPPMVRIDGELERMRYRVLTEGDFYNLVGPITPPKLWETFNATGDADYAYQMREEAPFRVNPFRPDPTSS